MKSEREKIKALFHGQRETLNKEHQAILAANHAAVWIHAASVGEFEQARPLIEMIRGEASANDRHDSKQRIVVTFFSPSGYEARKNYDQADAVLYLPFATRRKARKFLENLQPKMAIFVKYEFWPAYLRELKKRGVPTFSISAIFRPQQRFFHWYGKGALRLLHHFTHIYVQDEASRRLLAEHGVHEVSVAGDTRFDRVHRIVEDLNSKEQRSRLADSLKPIAEFVAGSNRVIVGGSTWPKDEVLLKQFIENQTSVSGVPTKLILVPHEIDETHLHFLFNLFQGRFVRYSALCNMPDGSSRHNILQNVKIMVIDTIGLLSSIYHFGHVAYIGGGFGAGIHNTIEAAVYGIPVLFGPNYQNFREAKGLIDVGAARSIANYQELDVALMTALDQHEAIGAKAAAYVESEIGATERIYKQIFK